MGVPSWHSSFRGLGLDVSVSRLSQNVLAGSRLVLVSYASRISSVSA